MRLDKSMSSMRVAILSAATLTAAGCAPAGSGGGGNDQGLTGLAQERVSVSGGGAQGDLSSYTASISSDGRYVAFVSTSTNLVTGDGNNAPDAFVYDRQADTIERVSVSDSGTEGDSNSYSVSISADGRYVAFDAFASNLVAGDNNDVTDVFVYDRQTDTVERVSVSGAGAEGNNGSANPSISADGRYVAFDSYATNLVGSDGNGVRDIFVYDRQADTIERVSVSDGGAEGDQNSYSPSISADGRYVAFDSTATTLVASDTNGVRDIFVYDRQAGTIERVSVSSSGTPADDSSFRASISADGRYVAFESSATNLVSGDGNGASDVFVYDRQTAVIERVSRSGAGVPGNSDSTNASISADGRYVAFESSATNLASGDANGALDVFVYDRQTGTIVRVSVNSDGLEGDSESGGPAISGDGGTVAFESDATNLVSGDTNGTTDVLVAPLP
jgi:Tol biopolymer transport system component